MLHELNSLTHVIADDDDDGDNIDDTEEDDDQDGLTNAGDCLF